MKERKSFIMYKDSKAQIDLLNDNQKGKLLTAIFDYQIEGEYFSDDPVVNVVMAGLISQFKRDSEKYLSICERNAKNGKKGGRPATAEKPTGLFGNPKNQSEPKKADSDSDSERDSDILYMEENEELINQQPAIAEQKDCGVSAPRKKFEYMPDFELFWAEYPKRLGGSPKYNAFKAYQKAVKAGFEPSAIQEHASTFKTFCDASKKTGTEYVPMASTWLNQRQWEGADWSLENIPANSSCQPLKDVSKILRNSEWSDGEWDCSRDTFATIRQALQDKYIIEVANNAD